jgi:hypothetical protein
MDQWNVMYVCIYVCVCACARAAWVRVCVREQSYLLTEMF